jgi:Putative esterase/Carbohydrate-binding module 48 (Isoamylase N-terminal domain)
VKRLALVLTAVAAGVSTASSQMVPEPQRDRAPASIVASGPIKSPEVSVDGSVTFRLRAPHAREVLVGGVTPTPIPMQKDARGNWSVTTPPLTPDLYAYSFVVDGMRMLDPSNPRVRPAYDVTNQSLVLVPGANAWTPRPDVERGAVARHSFHSAVAGDDRDYWVYTPANYDPARKAPYPVLYLMHGLFDDAKAWIEVGAVNVILDNLIAQGRATPMVVEG